MRILVLTHYFPPETGAASERTAALVTGLAADGHDVHVLTARPSFPSGALDAAYRGRGASSERRCGAWIERVWTYASPRQRGVDRIGNWLSVGAGMIGAIVRDARRGASYDLVFASFPPVTQAVVAIAAHRLLRAPLVIDVRDVLLDRGVQLGIWRPGSLLHRIVGMLGDRLYHEAYLIATLNETCRSQIAARGVPVEKIAILANGFDAFEVDTRSPYVAAPGEFVVAYVGNIGMTSGVDVVLDAAALLRAEPRVRFVIVGDGNQRVRLERRVATEQLANVTFLGHRSGDEAKAVQRDADLCVVPLRDMVHDTIPKKLYDALALRTPVIVAACGEAARFVRESGGGVVVDPENPRQLANAIRYLALDRARCAEYGAAGCAFVTEHYERGELVRGFVRRMVPA